MRVAVNNNEKIQNLLHQSQPYQIGAFLLFEDIRPLEDTSAKGGNIFILNIFVLGGFCWGFFYEARA